MNDAIKWGGGGAIIGTLVPGAALIVDMIVGERTGGGIIEWIVRNPSNLVLFAMPLFVSIGAVLYGTSRKDLIARTRELEFLRSQLNDTEQQEEIRKLMEELSVNLDHLVDITNNIREAICVVDRNHAIEFGYNKSFLDIFGQGEYIGKSIYDTIFSDMPPVQKKELREFLDLCFENTATSDDMINDVNPIHRFSILAREEAGVREKILRSKVVRIKNLSGAVENVMIIFNDITLDEKLDVAFEKQEKAFQDELEIMAVIYKNEREIMMSFISETTSILDRIQNRYVDIRQDEYNTDILLDIQGAVHLIKGEAFSLGFNDVAQAAKKFEDYLKAAASQVVTMEVNLGLIETYESLYERINRVNAISQKLFSLGGGLANAAPDDVVLDARRYEEIKSDLTSIVESYRRRKALTRELLNFQRTFEHLDYLDLRVMGKELSLINEKAAMQYGKRSVLNFIYDVDGLPEVLYRALKEVLVHLIRNSIAHGIEELAVRRERQKDDAGRINIHLYQEGKDYVVMYSDDGAGFDIEKIRHRAVEKNIVAKSAAVRLPEKDVLRLIFNADFSTTADPDMVSGLGIGMTAVKNAVSRSLKGRLLITNRPGKGMLGKIVFPAAT